MVVLQSVGSIAYGYIGHTVIVYSFDQSVKFIVYITYGISVAVGGFGLIAATCAGSATVDILILRC